MDSYGLRLIFRYRVMSKCGISIIPNFNPRIGITKNLIVFKGALAFFMHKHTALLSVVNPITAEGGISFSPNCYFTIGIAENVIVFEHSEPLCMNSDTGQLSIMDPVAAEDGISPTLDGHPPKRRC